MKCQLTLKAVRNSLLVCLFLGGVVSNDAYAVDSIETTLYKAESILKKHPAHLAKFKAFKDRVYTQLRSFLDTNNKETFSTHIGYIEQNMEAFYHDIANHDHFKCIKGYASPLYADFKSLLALLRSYIGTKSATILGLALKCKFEHLLPKVIVQECGGATGLISRLQHRLDCC